MGGTDRFDDGESEPGSAAGAGAGLVGAIKAFEHVGQSVSRNAEAVIGDFENRADSVAANTDLDHATYRCVFDGVIDEVHDYLLQDRKSTRLNSSHQIISYAVFCLKKKKTTQSYYRPMYTRLPAPDPWCVQRHSP